MKHRWLEEENSKTCEQLEQELDCKVKSITEGNIIVGYVDTIDENGKPVKLPVTCKGIEIEFEGEPSDEQLARLDIKFMGLKREGGKDLIAEIDELKTKIEKLEKK